MLDGAVSEKVDEYLKLGQRWAGGDEFVTERQHSDLFDEVSAVILRVIEETDTGQAHPALGA